MNTYVHNNNTYRRRVLLFGLFLLALCFTQSAVAQDLIYSIERLSPSPIYEGIPQGDRLVGPKIRFSISLSRPLRTGQSLQLTFSTEGQLTQQPGIPQQTGILRLVSGDGVSLNFNKELFTQSITFSGANAQTATLEWQLNDNSALNPGGDNDILISLGSMPTPNNISSNIRRSGTNSSITFRVLDDEYLLCFSQRSYSVREGDNTNLPIIELRRGENADTTIGLNRNTTVTLIYTDETAFKNVDYNPITPVVIKAGENSFTLENLIVRDNRIEGEEQFSIVIGESNPPSNLTETQAMNNRSCRQTTVTIGDPLAIYIRSKVFLEGPLQ